MSISANINNTRTDVVSCYAIKSISWMKKLAVMGMREAGEEVFPVRVLTVRDVAYIYIRCTHIH